MLPRNFSLILLGGFVLLAGPSQAVFAQVAVQQPVFEATSVNTTVSVPDRGRIHLGSIGQARESRTTFGPLRSGTNIGLDRQHTGVSVGVYVHDFEAMDQYLLNQGTTSSPAGSSHLSGNAGHAWNQLQARHSGLPSTAQIAPQPAAKSEKYWRLGQQAEREGKRSVAKLYYRIAGKYGSEAAKTRLVQWDASESSATGLAASAR